MCWASYGNESYRSVAIVVTTQLKKLVKRVTFQSTFVRLRFNWNLYCVRCMKLNRNRKSKHKDRFSIECAFLRVRPWIVYVQLKAWQLFILLLFKHSNRKCNRSHQFCYTVKGKRIQKIPHYSKTLTFYISHSRHSWFSHSCLFRPVNFIRTESSIDQTFQLYVAPLWKAFSYNYRWSFCVHVVNPCLVQSRSEVMLIIFHCSILIGD